MASPSLILLAPTLPIRPAHATARDFVNHPRGAALLPDGGIRVSSIYRWFREDFGGDDAGVIAHPRRHAGPPLAAGLQSVPRVAEDAYDRVLNDTSPAPRT